MKDREEAVKFWFLVKFPLSVGAVALTVFSLSLVLQHVPQSRHKIDQLASKFSRAVHSDGRAILVFGDSVTEDMLDRFSIASDKPLIDGTTNKASGLYGVYFLLKRYLKRNPAPEVVLIASTPEFYSYIPKNGARKTYIDSVFITNSEKVEIDELLGPTEERWHHRFDLSVLGDRLVGSVFGRSLKGGLVKESAPDRIEKEYTSTKSEKGVLSQSVQMDLDSRGRKSLEIDKKAQGVIFPLCKILKDHGILLAVFDAPVPFSVYQAWKHSGMFARFLHDRAQVLSNGQCEGLPWLVLGTKKIYPDYAFRDADHLRRHIWLGRYASELQYAIRSNL